MNSPWASPAGRCVSPVLSGSGCCRAGSPGSPGSSSWGRVVSESRGSAPLRHSAARRQKHETYLQCKDLQSVPIGVFHPTCSMFQWLNSAGIWTLSLCLSTVRLRWALCLSTATWCQCWSSNRLPREARGRGSGEEAPPGGGGGG